MASRYDYACCEDKPLTGEEAKGFAWALVNVCWDIADGSNSYDEELARAVGNGLAPADVRGMLSYMENRFCPAVLPEAR
jgi:hypothetical protein